MSTLVRPQAYDVPAHAYAALDAAGDGTLVVEVDSGGAHVRYASPAFCTNFVQREDLQGRPVSIETATDSETLASLIESPLLKLPWRGPVLVRGLDLNVRRATLVIRELPGGAAPLRVCCTLIEEPVTGDAKQAWVLPAELRHHQAVITQLASVIAVVCPDGTIIHQSAAMTAISRYSLDERVGRPMWEIVNPDDQPMVREWLHEVAALPAGQARELEYRIRRRDGQWRWVHVKAANLTRDPVIAGIVLQVDDCTERRVAQMMLSQAQESLQLAAEAARIAFWEYSLPAGTFTASEEYRRLRGLPPAAASLGDDGFWQAVHPDDVAELETALVAVLAGSGDAWDCTYRLRTGDDGWIWVHQRGHVVARDSESRPNRLAGILFDVDERKRAEQELRARDVRFQLAAKATRGHIYEYDPSTGAVSRWSGVKELLGLDPDELPGHAEAWFERVHPEDRDVARNHDQWPETADGVIEGHYRVRHADGRYLDVWDRAVRVAPNDPADQRQLGIVLDVSAQRRVERLLATAESVARVGSWELDVATFALRWSDETYVLHGVTRETYEPEAETYARFLTEQGQAQLWAHNAACIRDGGSYELELQIVPATGKKLWVRIVAVAQTIDGRVERLFGAVQDIDALKRRGIRLQRQSHWLTLALATNELTTWRWYPDTDQFVLDHRSHGYLDELPSRQPLGEWLTHLTPSCRESFRAALRSTADTGDPVDIQCRMPAPAGERHLEIRAERAVSPDGIALIGTLRDVTASRATEQHLRTQAEVLSSMGEGVCVVGPDHAVRLTNPAFDRMFRTGPAGLTGRRLDDVLELPAGGGPAREIEVVREDGSRFFAAVTVSPLVLHGEALQIVIVRDVTDRKELQIELLETANREQRRIGSDLHDGLGQELTGIALLLRGLEERAARGATLAPPDIAEIVALVNQAIQSTRALARGLSPVEIERGGLAYALRALVNRARDLYALDIRFQARTSRAVTLPAAAKTHLYRIVQEALTNAARHARATRVVVRLRVLSGRVSVSVDDDGTGLDPTTPDAGMGLKIMRYRAEIIGATLKVVPAKPSGTRIYCSVVQPAGEPAPKPGPARARRAADQKGT